MESKRESYDRFTLALRAVQKISECTTFDVLAITFCRKVRLTSFLIRWNWNFMGLFNIQKYTAIFFEVEQNIDDNNDFLRIDPKMSMILILWSSERLVVHPWLQGHHH